MRVGDLVECRCDFYPYINNYDFDVEFPKANRVYTVRNIRMIGDFKGITLEEIVNPMVETESFGLVEIQFDTACFRVVPEADLSELKKLL